jgi:hypothetical protein
LQLRRIPMNLMVNNRIAAVRCAHGDSRAHRRTQSRHSPRF